MCIWSHWNSCNSESITLLCTWNLTLGWNKEGNWWGSRCPGSGLQERRPWVSLCESPRATQTRPSQKHPSSLGEPLPPPHLDAWGNSLRLPQLPSTPGTTAQPEGCWSWGSGASASGDEPEQVQGHRGRTEESDHMGQGSWHSSRKWNFFLEAVLAQRNNFRIPDQMALTHRQLLLRVLRWEPGHASWLWVAAAALSSSRLLFKSRGHLRSGQENGVECTPLVNLVWMAANSRNSQPYYLGSSPGSTPCKLWCWTSYLPFLLLDLLLHKMDLINLGLHKNKARPRISTHKFSAGYYLLIATHKQTEKSWCILKLHSLTALWVPSPFFGKF